MRVNLINLAKQQIKNIMTWSFTKSKYHSIEIKIDSATNSNTSIYSKLRAEALLKTAYHSTEINIASVTESITAIYSKDLKHY